MLSKEEALQAARQFLEAAYADDSSGWTIVVLPDGSYRYHAGWAVRFDSQEALDSGQPWVGPMMKILLVPDDGSEPEFPPTNIPVPDYLEKLAAGEWPAGGDAR
ncbi:YrhB domain-containing protein [Streptomyces sp. NPDC059816]|uniref:YrhB domain-containing protein n=1 Tax=Streptomyces sp. NPDC059816 TaxID=3346960 RepID=UPI0036550DBD